jgi:6-phosphogluconolactonase (cycloisomerase 2 family)
MVSRALVIAILSVLMVALSPGLSQAQSTLTVVDSEPLPEDGPGDNVVFSVRRNRTFVVALAFNTGEAVTHRLERDGSIGEEVGRTYVGPEPRAIALAHGGELAVVANSIANELGVFEVGDDGLLREINRVPSGGLNPFDVAVAYNEIVVVTNHDSDQINTFHIERRGRLTALDNEPTGLEPHVVSVSRRGGMVAVSNRGERSVSIFELDRRGELTQFETIPVDATPQASAWEGRNVFVAIDRAFPEEDVIRVFAVRRNGEVVQGGDTAAGVFLTGLAARSDMLFAVTANRNDPANPTDDRNEIRAYRIEGNELVLDASVQTPGFPPSFKQVTARRGRGGIRHVLVTEFQAGWLRSLIYEPDEP